MGKDYIPEWMLGLEEEDFVFMKRFIIASGSLKEVAANYQVTYPTVRLRLDRLIQKIKMAEDTTENEYITLIKKLALDEKLDFETAKILVNEYKKEKGRE